ncbi:L-rhamnose/proton symporter RhaT [Sphingobacterium daejeonense]|mgnify:FL=1|jgi:L-rhamnose-H+ transport protein|uniref:L-rhamnose/proton symporter RhaT n=1 Tax=Sphingobacterium daejeonense TaxID=371142 RepID=A0ABW3RHY2_9SPHI|nr:MULTISPECIES: L-rhamnose/proton symporter RhaT [Sphingobacterium]MCT1533086.1 L-rhamnose/proton symporter RhaT [Sphingobacterium daejeonense]VTQ04768.1 L-rhamnose-H(+) transport protein [Sphingobacterium daejeonense]
MNALAGVIFHFIGGFASGSFYVPYKKVKGWSWESMWILGGLFSWIIVPPIAAWLTIPNFADIISNTDSSILGYTFLFGILWGIGGLTYGLGVRYLGVSLGSSVILGLSMVFGSLMPAVYYFFNKAEGKHGIDYFFTDKAGICVMIGLLVCVIGIYLCGKAGVLKEKSLGTLSSEAKSDYNFGLGIVVAIVSGVLSACFNFGIESGKPMADVANNLWKAANPNQGEFLYQNNVTYIVILWGGFTTNFLWCLYLLIKNHSFSDYTKSSAPLAKNFLLCAIAGTTWYLQFFFYGMGESRLGNGASSWILHMAFIILISNAWGIALKEWKGVSKPTYTAIIAGIATIIISICIVGFAKTLE